jgi:hypothetical protein
MQDDPKWRLRIGTIEMKESRKYALEKLFVREYNNAIQTGVDTLAKEPIVGQCLSHRCKDLTSIKKALEIGEMAGYILSPDSNEVNENAIRARFSTELCTLVLLLRLRGAVAASSRVVLKTVLDEERMRLSSSLLSHVGVNARREISLLEADDRDYQCRLLLLSALSSGTIRTTAFAESEETNIDVRPLDRALFLVPFVMRKDVDASFIKSETTEQLAMIGAGFRKLRIRCKLLKWPREDLEQVHGEILYYHEPCVILQIFHQWMTKQMVATIMSCLYCRFKRY